MVVTRTREQASGLSQRLAELGAEAIELPVLKVTKSVKKQDLADVMLELGSYDWIVFTSQNGVRYFFEEFFRLFDDIRALGMIRVACVGESTARAVADLHLKIECTPKGKATAEALADTLVATGSLDSAKVLVVTGSLNRDVLVRKLEFAQAIVDQFPVYETERVDLAASPVAADYRARGADAVLFASSSSAEFFASQGAAVALEPGALQPVYGSIGAQTSESMRAAGLAVGSEAESPGLDGLLEALVAKLAAKPAGRGGRK